jgi:dolichol-phosphate mannosyltransferase
LFKLAWHGVTSFSYVPLQMATYFGFIVSTISFLIGIYMLYRKIFLDIPLVGYASLIVSLFFLGGVILLVLGVIGEYIGRIYTEVQNRPLYIIKEETG